MNQKESAVVKEEKLYLFEFFLDFVSLYTEKLEKIDPSTLGVDINHENFPLIRISQAGFELTKKEKSKQVEYSDTFRTIKFNAGKSFLFTINPSDFVRKLKSHPLELDMYQVKGIVKCPYEVLKHNLGYTKIPMSGCLCDQTEMAANDKYHLPKSYEIKNTFNLLDSESNPTGFVKVIVRLTCFGKCLNMKYSILDQKLLYANSNSVNEFLCVKVAFLNEKERKTAEDSSKICEVNKEREESELDSPPRSTNVAGLLLPCRELSK